MLMGLRLAALSAIKIMKSKRANPEGQCESKVCTVELLTDATPIWRPLTNVSMSPWPFNRGKNDRKLLLSDHCSFTGRWPFNSCWTVTPKLVIFFI